MARGKSGSKSSLKTALQSQQHRLRKKEQAARAAQVAESSQRGRKGPHGPTKTDVKSKGKPPSQKVTVPFKATDRILLVGEGNFSFARALAFNPPTPERIQPTPVNDPGTSTSAISLEFLPPTNLTATAYDTEEDCFSKYPDARENVEALRAKGAEVLFGIDATRLEKYSQLKGRRWDRVLWNFPHAGKGIADQDRNILSNQLLVLGFLHSAQHILALGPVPTVHKKRVRKSEDDDDDDETMATEAAEDTQTEVPARGTVLITLRNVSPYTLWDVPKLAKNPPPPPAYTTPYPRYKQLRSFAFVRSAWKGYEHRMTKGERVHGTGTTGIGGEDRTWEFCLAD